MKPKKLIPMSLGTIALAAIVILTLTLWPPRPKATFRPCGVAANQINRFSARKSPEKGMELVFYCPWKWRQTTLRVFFEDVGDEQLQKKVLSVANTWKPYTGIKFVRAETVYDSEIRLAFRAFGGYQSVIGSLADSSKILGLSLQTTMYLENLDERSEDEFRRVVLHEFGHALGLLHELASIHSPIAWDSAAVYKYFAKAYHWDSLRVNEQVLTPAGYAQATTFDPRSIMIYAIPAFLMKNHSDIPWPGGLSQDDKSKIKLLYP